MELYKELHPFSHYTHCYHLLDEDSGDLQEVISKLHRARIFINGDSAWCPELPPTCLLWKTSSFVGDCSRPVPFEVKFQPFASPGVPLYRRSFLTSFVGTVTSNPGLRGKLKEVLDAETDPRIFTQYNADFWPNLPPETRFTGYDTIMRQSQYVFCPRGAGSTSIRFFEAFAYGCIPILISDNTKIPQGLPPYIHLPESQIHRWRDYVC